MKEGFQQAITLSITFLFYGMWYSCSMNYDPFLLALSIELYQCALCFRPKYKRLLAEKEAMTIKDNDPIEEFGMAWQNENATVKCFFEKSTSNNLVAF